MRAITTVLGKDMVGVLARVSAICVENQVDVIRATQSVLQDMFAMIMVVDIPKGAIPFSDLADRLTELGTSTSLTIHTMHEDILNSMHRI